MDHIKIRFGNPLGNQAGKSEPDFEKTVDDLFRSINPMFTLAERKWKPQMDIFETPDEIFILGEVSGVKKEKLEIEVSAKAVKIKGYRDDMSRVDKATYRLAEIQYGKFERVLFLPAPIDTDDVTASLSEGFLTVRLAKRRSKTHKIPISNG